MQLICISRGSYAFGSEVAKRLAGRLGYACVAREEITDAATDQGIPVGKLEVEVMRNRPLSEELAVQMDLFKAFVSATLCERTMSEGGTVYHGRSGHLALPGVSHVLRVRTIADMEFRVRMVMARMGLTAEKAKKYVEQVDEDIRRWVRIFHKEDWEDPSLYDVTVNAAHLSEENAAAALMTFHNLPEFQATPASTQALKDLLLASRCRLAIGRDERTRKVKAMVRADKGNVSVTYLPRQARESQAIPAVRENEPGIGSLVCSIATTNILYLAEEFDPEAKDLEHLISISEKWNAAIELVRIGGESNGAGGETEVATPAEHPAKPSYDGGIMDDEPESARPERGGHGLAETMDRLIQVGRAGGFRDLGGDVEHLSANLSGKENYSLVVVGDVFASKGGARQRMKRDFLGILSDHFRVPVLGMEELKARYLFGRKQLIDLLVFVAVSVVIYTVVFRFQEPILTFLSKGHFDEKLGPRIAASLAVALFTPIVALSMGGAYKNLLKLIKME